MTMESLTTFFMWCTILNGSIMIYWIAWCILAPNLVYKIQSKWFPMPRETFNVIIYSLLGLFKIFFMVFNVVPYLALVIMS